MKNTTAFRTSVLALLVTLSTTAAYARSCPVSGRPLPSVEQRQFTVPAKLLTCFLTSAEIAVIYSSIGHDAQTTVTDPSFESGDALRSRSVIRES